MRNDNLNNKQSLDAMSLTRQRLLPQTRSESGYLAMQETHARSAMSRTVHDMKETMKGMVSIKQHPWLITGSAVAVGLAAGAVMAYSHGKSTNRPLSNSTAELQPGFQEEGTAKARKSILFSTLGTVLAGILKIVVQGLLAPAVVSKDRVETHSHHDFSGSDRF